MTSAALAPAPLASHSAGHWWHAGMRRVTRALASEIEGRVLDMGCGPGWDLQELPPAAWGVGIDMQHAASKPERFVLADAARLPFAGATFDLVLALDFLEQRTADPGPALREALRTLRPNGRLIIRVPAHRWLQGPRDAYWGTARRYGRVELASLVLGAGFRIERLTYANCLLFPLAALARLSCRALQCGRDDMRPLPPILNRLLLSLLLLEACWLRRRDLPMGLSLVCLAKRKG